VALELPRFLAATRALPPAWPRGDGHAVVVIPGYGMTDPTTWALRRALTRLGYAAHGWGLGRNVGARRGLVAALHARLDALVGTSGRAVSLIGWSLGGVFARELARARPASVRRVFTLGSPFSGEPDANPIDHLRGILSRRPVAIDRGDLDARRPAPPVPCIALHTKTDGIVHWRCSLEAPGPGTENVEVRGSHAGLICNLEVLRVLADRLPL
jgi:pimeloyl-ACP methyl ester carboxylesterase